MPHDKNGKLLSVGDKVIITGKIKEIHNTEEYCNCSVAVDPMPPYTDPYILSALNTKQVEKVEK